MAALLFVLVLLLAGVLVTGWFLSDARDQVQTLSGELEGYRGKVTQCQLKQSCVAAGLESDYEHGE